MQNFFQFISANLHIMPYLDHLVIFEHLTTQILLQWSMHWKNEEKQLSIFIIPSQILPLFSLKTRVIKWKIKCLAVANPIHKKKASVSNRSLDLWYYMEAQKYCHTLGSPPLDFHSTIFVYISCQMIHFPFLHLRALFWFFNRLRAFVVILPLLLVLSSFLDFFP